MDLQRPTYANLKSRCEEGVPISGLSGAAVYFPGSRDPDGQRFRYAEAGATGLNAAAVQIAGDDTAKATVTPTAARRPAWRPLGGPCSCAGTAHIILEVTGEGAPKRTGYRRVILTVRSTQGSP
jgi:hypothetical protein